MDAMVARVVKLREVELKRQHGEMLARTYAAAGPVGAGAAASPPATGAGAHVATSSSSGRRSLGT